MPDYPEVFIYQYLHVHEDEAFKLESVSVFINAMIMCMTCQLQIQSALI